FYGLKNNEEVLVEIGPGKTLIITMLYVSDPDESGYRVVAFELNGQTRRIRVKDISFKATKELHRKAEDTNEIGAPLQGRIAAILVEKGEEVKENTPMFIIEAMKMESTITASSAGKVKAIHLTAGTMVEQDDLVVELEA